MTDAHLPFFVYGTLLPGEGNHGLLDSRTRAWTPAVLPAALLFHGPGHPYAVPDPAAAGSVRGQVVTLAEDAYAATLAALDHLERYVPGNPGNLYERQRVTVRARSGETEAWTYFAAPRLARELLISGIAIPGGDWLRREAGIPREPS